MSNETAAASIGTRIRENLVLAQTRVSALEHRARTEWLNLPHQLRVTVDRVAAGLRDRLDIPSRSELAELIERIEQVDAKLADLEQKQAEARAKAPAAKKDTARSQKPSSSGGTRAQSTKSAARAGTGSSKSTKTNSSSRKGQAKAKKQPKKS